MIYCNSTDFLLAQKFKHNFCLAIRKLKLLKLFRKIKKLFRKLQNYLEKLKIIQKNYKLFRKIKKLFGKIKKSHRHTHTLYVDRPLNLVGQELLKESSVSENTSSHLAALPWALLLTLHFRASASFQEQCVCVFSRSAQTSPPFQPTTTTLFSPVRRVYTLPPHILCRTRALIFRATFRRDSFQKCA